MRFKNHRAPCGMPCKLKREAELGEEVHEITDECEKCILLKSASNKILYNGEVVNKEDVPNRNWKMEADSIDFISESVIKTPWDKIVIPPHAFKMMKIRAGFDSVVDAAIMVERLYPLSSYIGSQKKARGTSHTKRTKPGKNKNKSQQIDLFEVSDDGISWVFYMKRNIIMTIHRNDEFDTTGPAISNSDVES